MHSSGRNESKMLFVNSTEIARNQNNDSNICTDCQKKLTKMRKLTLKLYMDGIVLSVCTSSIRNSSMSCKPVGGKLTNEVPDRSLRCENIRFRGKQIFVNTFI